MTKDLQSSHFSPVSREAGHFPKVIEALASLRSPAVRVLGLHAVALESNPVLKSGQDLFPVVPDSTLPRVVNSQLNCFFQIIKSVVPVN